MSVRVKMKSNLRALKGRYRAKVERVVAETAVEVASIARQLAPRDTGHLAEESIAVVLTPSTGVARVVARTADAEHPEYALHVEFGTANADAQPFMGPAFEAVRPRMRRRLAHLKP